MISLSHHQDELNTGWCSKLFPFSVGVLQRNTGWWQMQEVATRSERTWSKNAEISGGPPLATKARRMWRCAERLSSVSPCQRLPNLASVNRAASASLTRAPVASVRSGHPGLLELVIGPRSPDGRVLHDRYRPFAASHRGHAAWRFRSSLGTVPRVVRPAVGRVRTFRRPTQAPTAMVTKAPIFATG